MWERDTDATTWRERFYRQDKGNHILHMIIFDMTSFTLERLENFQNLFSKLSIACESDSAEQEHAIIWMLGCLRTPTEVQQLGCVQKNNLLCVEMSTIRLPWWGSSLEASLQHHEKLEQRNFSSQKGETWWILLIFLKLKCSLAYASVTRGKQKRMGIGLVLFWKT